MRNDYPLQGSKKVLSIEVEASVAESVQNMEKHTQISVSELTNMALKRFISSHQDFLPTEPPASPRQKSIS